MGSEVEGECPALCLMITGPWRWRGLDCGERREDVVGVVRWAGLVVVADLGGGPSGDDFESCVGS